MNQPIKNSISLTDDQIENQETELNKIILYYKQLKYDLDIEIKSQEKDIEIDISKFPTQIEEISNELKENFKNIRNPFK